MNALFSRRIISTIGLLIFVAVSGLASGGTELPDLLVETEWVADNIDSDDVVIIDTGRSIDDYRAGHVPGAVFVPVSAYYAEVDGVPGMFPGADPVEAVFREAGVDGDSVVVIYDAGNGLWATRLFWTFELLGHPSVGVVNGGIGRWVADGRELSTNPPEVESGDFTARLNEKLLASGDEIAATLESTIVLDTRSPGEYEGTDVRAARGGHIPGAVNVNWIYNNIQDEVTTFLPTDELAEFYQAELDGADGRIVTHCQTGVRGAHTYFVLRLLGYEDVALYDGSWVEWGNNDVFPVEGE